MDVENTTKNLEKMFNDPVYRKLESFDPEKFINKDRPTSRFWINQVKLGIEQHINYFEAFKKNHPEMYEKLLTAEDSEIVEAILNPKYIPNFDYGLLVKH